MHGLVQMHRGSREFVHAFGPPLISVACLCMSLFVLRGENDSLVALPACDWNFEQMLAVQDSA